MMFWFSADFKLETLGDTAQIPRLASSLSACAQLNTLSAGQRTWALSRLRKLVLSEVGPSIDVPSLFGYNLTYEQPLIKLKQNTDQRMSTVGSRDLPLHSKKYPNSSLDNNIKLEVIIDYYWSAFVTYGKITETNSSWKDSSIPVR